MDNEKVCIHCCTVYQLFVANCLALSKFSNDEIVLVLSSSMPNVEVIGGKLKKANLFREVLVLENETVDWNKSLYTIPIFWKLRFKTIIRGSIIERQKFDRYIFAGLGGFSNVIGQWLRMNNPDLIVELYEEGASSYSELYHNAVVSRKKNKNIFKRFFYNMFPHMLTLYTNFYYFCPDLALWGDSDSKVKISPIVEYKKVLIKTMNDVFDFALKVDTYSQRVIFFEESYYSDGIDVNDIEIVNDLEKQYGKENILIKRHPRNRKDRFGELGYYTSVENSVPWEVIALNIPDLDNKILVTMTSTALISTFLLFNTHAQMVFRIRNLPENNDRVKYTKTVIEKLADLYPDRFYLQ